MQATPNNHETKIYSITSGNQNFESIKKTKNII